MADYTYHLQYRLKNSSLWTTGGTGIPRDATTKEMTHTIAAGVLTKGQTYEFRWVRISRDGTATPLANSNVVEALIPISVPTLDDSEGTPNLNGAGTYSITLDGNALTVVRSANNLTLQLTANWEHVRIDLDNPLDGTTKYFTEKTSGFPDPAGYTPDAAVIAKTSSKTVDIKLSASYAYTVTVKFSGASTGTIRVNSYIP